MKRTKRTARDVRMVQTFSVVVLSLLTAGLALSSCNEEDWPTGNFDYTTLEDGIGDDVHYFSNAPYPTDADTLRILTIGSSFTEDATYYIDMLARAAGIDAKRLGIYKVVTGFARFNTWTDTWEKADTVYAKKVTGDVTMKVYGPMHDIVAQPWDVIILSQASDASYKWDTFVHLRELMEKILNACTNRRVCFAYQLQWSHVPKEMPYVMQGNVACSEKMSRRYGIDVIIPCGTAVQLARNTRLNDSRYMTRDSYHLNLGMGCYVASCAWFEKLLAPVFGTAVVGNGAQPDGDYSSEEVLLAQRCAAYAVENQYDYEHKMEQVPLPSDNPL